MNQDTVGILQSEAANHACVTCRKQKRRCTKELPVCSLCQRLNKPCDYDSDAPTTSDELSALKDRIEELEERLTKSFSRDTDHHRAIRHHQNGFAGRTSGVENRESREFPVVVFLDREIARLLHPLAPKPVAAIPDDVLSVLGSHDDILDITRTFFRTVHLWLPCVSKKRMELMLRSPSFTLQTDSAALFLAMRLITDRSLSSSGNHQSQLYSMTKRYSFDLEVSGFISLPLIQASVLICAYEAGHGIYPSAYISAGRCARLGQVYGIDNRRDAQQLGPKPGSWAEVEEIKRTWWAILLLDRFVNMGIHGHSLATGDVRLKDVLPADCSSWDDGQISTAEPVYVFSPTNVKAGPFTRTCQAATLMGRFIRHRDDTDSESTQQFEEAIQLQKTILAFSKLLPDEVMQNPLQCSTAMALNLSMLMLIYDNYCCAESNHKLHSFEATEMQAIAITGLRSTADEILRFTNVLETSMVSDFTAMSPLTIDCVYQAASTFAWLVHENGTTEMIDAYSFLKGILTTMSRRWGIANEYLKIMDRAKTQLYNDNPLL